MRRAALLAAVALAILVPPAAAHGGGGNGYRSTVTSITPATPGLTVRVLQQDDRLSISNRTGKEIVILGYENEPYLRFRPGGGVDVNARSPASTLNTNRYGKVELPPNADPGATPRWQRVATGQIYTWHDHRIHWMSTIDPPAVRNARGSPHHVFDWTVPVRVGGLPVTVHGALDYTPANHRMSRVWLIAPAVAALAALAFLYRSATASGRRASRTSAPRAKRSRR